MSSDCPICSRQLCSTNRVELECHHKLCHTCCFQWIIENETCPLCRRKSLYYYRELRSTKRHDLIVHRYVLTIKNIPKTLAIQYLYEHAKALDVYVLQNKHAWYRIQFFRTLQRAMNPFIFMTIMILEEVINLLETTPIFFKTGWKPHLQYSLTIYRKIKSFLSLDSMSMTEREES